MRSAWLASVGVVLSVSVGLGGCGGAGGPWGGSPLEDPPETELLVRLYYSEGCWTGGWEVEVYRDGRCRAHLTRSEEGGPIGLFEVQLDEQQLASVRMTVREAASAGLKRQYPWHSSDPPWCSQYIWVRGKLRYTGYDPMYRRNPAPLKALCRIEPDWDHGAMRGLLWEAVKRARDHPVSAVVLEGGATKSIYRVGEQVPVSLALRSVGTYPVAVAPVDVQEVVHGEYGVGLVPPPGTSPPISLHAGLATRTYTPPEDRPSRMARISFGGARPWRIRNQLSPGALADLDRFVILQPNEEFPLDWSQPVSQDRVGRYNLYAVYGTWERYDLSLINRVLSAPFADGVCEWTSPRTDIVK